jgi:hypothetical protein
MLNTRPCKMLSSKAERPMYILQPVTSARLSLRTTNFYDSAAVTSSSCRSSPNFHHTFESAPALPSKPLTPQTTSCRSKPYVRTDQSCNTPPVSFTSPIAQTLAWSIRPLTDDSRRKTNAIPSQTLGRSTFRSQNLCKQHATTFTVKHTRQLESALTRQQNSALTTTMCLYNCRISAPRLYLVAHILHFGGTLRTNTPTDCSDLQWGIQLFPTVSIVNDFASHYPLPSLYPPSPPPYAHQQHSGTPSV